MRKLDKGELAMLRGDLETHLRSTPWPYTRSVEPNSKGSNSSSGSIRSKLALLGYLVSHGQGAEVYENNDKQYCYEPGTDLEPVAIGSWARKED